MIKKTILVLKRARGTARGPFAFCAVLALASFAISSCTTTHYRNAADRETYTIIEDKTASVPGMPTKFDIEAEKVPELESLEVNEEVVAYLGVGAEGEVGARIISLEKALAIAFSYSRQYRNQEESLYLEALNLTLDRYRFAPTFSGILTGDYSRSTREQNTPNALGDFISNTQSPASKFILDMQALTGAPAALLAQYAQAVETTAALAGANLTQHDIIDQQDISGQTGVGMGVLLKSGGRFALNLTSNFMRFLTGGPAESAASLLSASFDQPLLRGAGRKVNAEALTQAERDVLYALRDFTRFRKTLAVDVATNYYRILRQRDAVNNNYRGLQSARRNLERGKAFEKEGLRTPAEVGRLDQNVLSRESAWENSVRSYQRRLDNFKIQLGLPVDAQMILDEGELAALIERGIIHPTLTASEAIEVALVTRLDLYTAYGRVEDAERKVYVAANQLKPGLDLILSAQVGTSPGNRPASLDFSRAQWSAGFDLDLPMNRKSERNAYRRALIALERTARDTVLFEDRVKLELRDASRTLDQSKVNYEISRRSVELSESRVEEQELKMELGMGNVLDLVDAQDDLTASQNSLTDQLVEHTVARLAFWRDMGILFIKEGGQWEEIDDVNL